MRGMAEKTQRSAEGAVKGALAWLKRRGSKRTRDGMARYGIPSDNDLTSPKVTALKNGKRR
jgi:hypothetical protein